MHKGQPVRTGVRQSCLVLPFMFLIAIDWIMQHVTIKKWNTMDLQLDDLDVADVLALLSHTQQQMQEKTNIVVEHSARLGMNIHRGKSKILKVSQSHCIHGSDRKGRTFHVYGQRLRHTGRN